MPTRQRSPTWNRGSSGVAAWSSAPAPSRLFIAVEFPLHLLSLKHGCLGGRQDRVPSVGRYCSVQPLIPYHIHRIEIVAYPLDLLAQCLPQHGNARVGRREVFEGMHGDRPLAFLGLKIIGLALTIFVFPR